MYDVREKAEPRMRSGLGCYDKGISINWDGKYGRWYRLELKKKEFCFNHNELKMPCIHLSRYMSGVWGKRFGLRA